MKTLAITSAILLSLASAAAADQRAENLGVTPGQFTTNELVQLQAALDSDDRKSVAYILAGGDDAVAKPSGISAGAAQLAATLDVAPGRFSFSELTELSAAKAADDRTRVNHILNGDDVVATRSVGVSAGAANLAATLGVEAGRFSYNELLQLQVAMASDDRTRVAYILGK